MSTRSVARLPQALACACAAVPRSGLLPKTYCVTLFVSLAASASGTTVLLTYWSPSPQQVEAANGLKHRTVIVPVGAVADTSNVMEFVSGAGAPTGGDSVHQASPGA